MNLALFDLDHTLLSGDSDVEWPGFLIKKGIVDAGYYSRESDRFYEQYKDGTLDIYAFLDFQLSPLAGRDRAELDAWHEEYLARYIRPIITARGRELIQQHQANGDLVVIITATNRFITGPIAAELGVEHLIATELEEGPDGRFTGRPSGLPSFQDGKIHRLHDWLASRGQRLEDFDRSWFYSDSRNDIPLMSVVTHPVAVNPDELLRAHAEAHGWPVMFLHD